ncbi:MAG: hypothetical protein EOO42_01060 [Flavobacteriales bacterium]|nr:MAG: hypothetical protein EOO42_01060 [Flavobacteriales bacterium]
MKKLMSLLLIVLAFSANAQVKKTVAKSAAPAPVAITKLLTDFGVKEKYDFNKTYNPPADKEVFIINGNSVFSKYKVYYKGGAIESIALTSATPQDFIKNKEYIISATRRAFGKEVETDNSEFSEKYVFKNGNQNAELYFSGKMADDSYNNINLFLK